MELKVGYQHIKILFLCSLIMYSLNLMNNNFIFSIFFGACSCAMVLPSYLFISGVEIRHKIESMPFLNFISRFAVTDDIRMKQNDRSLFLVVFVFCFVLFGLISRIVFPSKIEGFLILIGSFLFSLLLSLFLVRREMVKDNTIVGGE
jgi:hypothetical protein